MRPVARTENDCIRCCFNPRAPRGARQTAGRWVSRETSFNPRAPRGARRGPAGVSLSIRSVSIHAPRAGRDSYLGLYGRYERFNPRAPRGARPISASSHSSQSPFQSTRPARGAIASERRRQRSPASFQSTRPARGATSNNCPRIFVFSFQSTRPARGATTLTRPLPCAAVSIHAPRAGRDATAASRRLH